MKHKMILTVLGTSIFLILLLLGVHGASVASLQIEEEHSEHSSAIAPEGYTPTQLETVSGTFAVDGADVLLIQTSLPWDSNADTEVLTSLGYSYDIVDMSNIDTVNLFSYPVILIVNDQVQAFYDQYSNQIADFEAYVSSGGVLVFFAAGAGWAGGQLTAPLPGGVTWVDGYDPTNHIEDNSHPIVTGVLSDGNPDWGGPLTDGDLIGNYCSHGYFDNIPVDAQIILASDIWNEPTLMEYPLGSGKVIASTLTWEAYWAWYPPAGGPFAKKALDDVFLYAFSGGGTLIEDLEIDLRVEDAPDNIRVDKSAGSYVDIVAKISGGQAYTPTVTLEVPSDMFGTPVKTFTRNLPNNDGFGQEDDFDILSNGQYQIGTTLVELQNQSTYYKEVVWRFQIPSNTLAQDDIELNAIVAVPGLIVTNPTDQVKMDIIDWGLSIVVTNRQLLFDEYGTNNDWSEVSDLLEDVYKSLYFEWGEVFYVDHYEIEWNQTTNENDANNVAGDIDDLIEQWHNQLTKQSNGYDLEPDYLVVIGGDEIIPFYRMDDDDYSWCSITTCEEDGWAKNNGGNGPIWDVYDDNYFLSDNIYADVGGSQSDWEKGNLELAIGRIVGHDADAMRQLIENGDLETEPLNESVISSIGGSDVDGMKDRLEDKNVNIHGLNNPDLTENDNWTRDEFIDAWGSDSQFFYYGGHSNPFNWASGTEQSITENDLTAGQIGNNHPLLLSGGCNFGVPLDDRLTHHMVDLGFAGIVGSTGLVSFNALPWVTSGGEKLDNQYVEALIKTGPYSDYSNRFGETLREVKQNYNPLTGDGKKTTLEYVYYGLPWSFMETPDNAQILSYMTGDNSQDYNLDLSKPNQLYTNSYSTVLYTTVNSYTLSVYEGYDLILVDGAELLADPDSPALPYIMHTLFLPPASSVTNISILSENPVSLGQLNIPSIVPITEYDPGSGLIPFSGTGIHPAIRYSYETVPNTEYTMVEVVLFLAQFDADNSTLTLFDSTDLQIEYETDSTTVITDLSFSKPEFRGDETMTGQAEVQNVGATASTLTGILDLFSDNGTSIGQTTIPAFTVNAGENYQLPLAWPTSLPHGGYSTVLTIYDGGTPVAFMQGSFSVLSGRVSQFNVPGFAKPGEFSNVSLSFTNYRSETVNVIAEVLIYDDGIEVAKLLQRNFSVDALSEGMITWSWNPENLDLGTYTLKAIVTVDGEPFNVPQQSTNVGLPVFLPIILRSP